VIFEHLQFLFLLGPAARKANLLTRWLQSSTALCYTMHASRLQPLIDLVKTALEQHNSSILKLWL